MTTFRPRVQVPPDSKVGMRFGTAIDHAVARLAQQVLARHTFDPDLVEAVRLRCADTHDCRACRSLRSTAAEAGGLPDERTEVALRLTDAMLATPVVVDVELRGDIRRHFTDAEVADLALLVMKWAHQKVHVALRIEPPIAADSLTAVTFTPDGRTVLGGPVAP